MFMDFFKIGGTNTFIQKPGIISKKSTWIIIISLILLRWRCISRMAPSGGGMIWILILSSSRKRWRLQMRFSLCCRTRIPKQRSHSLFFHARVAIPSVRLHQGGSHQGPKHRGVFWDRLWNPFFKGRGSFLKWLALCWIASEKYYYITQSHINEHFLNCI